MKTLVKNYAPGKDENDNSPNGGGQIGVDIFNADFSQDGSESGKKSRKKGKKYPIHDILIIYDKYFKNPRKFIKGVLW